MLQPSSWNASWYSYSFAVNPRFDLFVDTVRADPPPSISCSRRRPGESAGVLSRPEGFSPVTNSSTGEEDLADEIPVAPNDAREDCSELIQLAKGSLFTAVLACCDWGEGYNAAVAEGTRGVRQQRPPLYCIILALFIC